MFLAVLGIEPRASDMLGKCMPTELLNCTPKPLTQVFMGEIEQIWWLTFLVLRNPIEPLSLVSVPSPVQSRVNQKPRLSAADPDRVQINEV